MNYVIATPKKVITRKELFTFTEEDLIIKEELDNELIEAVQQRKRKHVENMLQPGLEAYPTLKACSTAWKIALKTNQNFIIDDLLNKNLVVRPYQTTINLAIMDAVKRSQLKIVQLLLSYGQIDYTADQILTDASSLIRLCPRMKLLNAMIASGNTFYPHIKLFIERLERLDLEFCESAKRNEVQISLIFDQMSELHEFVGDHIVYMEQLEIETLTAQHSVYEPDEPLLRRGHRPDYQSIIDDADFDLRVRLSRVKRANEQFKSNHNDNNFSECTSQKSVRSGVDKKSVKFKLPDDQLDKI